MPDDDNDFETEPFGAADSDDDKFKDMRRTANQAAKIRKENESLAAQLADMQRKLAFADAGLTLTDRQKTALLAAHGTDELSRDALRATAAELKFIEPDEPDADAQAREAALATQSKIAAASTGARPPAAAPSLDERIRQVTTLPRDATSQEREQAWDEAFKLKALALSKQMQGTPLGS